MKSGQSSRGFTLLEILVVAALIGILALAAVPLLSSQNPTKLDVAAAEVGNALRFSIGEAERINGCAWVEGSFAGQIGMAAQFFVYGNTTPYSRLLIGPGTQLTVFDNVNPNPNPVGPLGPN